MSQVTGEVRRRALIDNPDHGPAVGIVNHREVEMALVVGDHFHLHRLGQAGRAAERVRLVRRRVPE